MGSIVGLIISVHLAHSSGIEGLGEYGLTFAVYGVALGVSGSAGANSALSLLPDDFTIRLFARRVSLIGGISGTLVTVVGIALSSHFLIILGLSLHGMLLHDYSRRINTSYGRGIRALVFESIVLGAVVVTAGISIFAALPTPVVFGAWCVASTISGYWQSVVSRLDMRPKWAIEDDNRSAIELGLENLAGAGTGHLLIGLLSTFFGLALVGIIRGGATVLGPANLVTTASQSLVIPILARARGLPRNLRVRRNLGVTFVITGSVAGLSTPFLLLPDSLGRLLLGGAWPDVQIILAFMTIDCLATAASVVAIAGHRVYGRARRLLTVSLLLVPARLVLAIAGAAFAGVLGASMGLALASVLGTVSYWVSYLSLSKLQLQSE